MHRQLANQLRRMAGLVDAEQVERVLSELRELADTAAMSGAARGLLTNLEGFLQRVAVSYAQNDRDLALRARSLELSSLELASANDRLQREAQIQRSAIEHLRDTANELLRGDGKPEIGTSDATALDELAALMAALVRERSTFQHELEMQKFAMDQHAIISITDIDGIIIYANDLFCKISGHSLDELIGQSHRVVGSRHHAEEFFRELWQTILDGRVWRGEICNTSKSGENYWVAATIVPLLDGEGRPERFIAIRTDITHRKRAEALIDESRSFLQGITDTLDDGVYRLDANLHCVFLNPEAERLLEITQAELAGRSFFDTIHLYDAAGQIVDISEFFRALPPDQPFRSEDYYLRRRSGEMFPVAGAIARLYQSSGEIGWVGSCRDISQSKRAQEELAAAKIEAERANHLKGQFLANMSHELRTPLNAVIGLGHLVQQTELQPQQRDYLQKMDAASQHLLGLINDVLDYSKIEAGKLVVENTPFSPAELVREVVNLLQPKALQKRLLLLFEIASGVPDVVLGDRRRLGQVLLNLADNALKFTERGDVTLALGSQPLDFNLCQLDISVRDTGIGLADEQMARLFKPFVQVDGTSARRFGGTGLGLAISRELIELMGGQIGVHSTVGQGSNFYIELPCRVAERTRVAAGPLQHRVHGSAKLNGYSALVVEDNSFNQELMRGLLRAWDMNIEIVASAEDGLQRLREQRFDIVLHDIVLPGIDGYESARRIRSDLQLTELPLLALTSHTQADVYARCLAAGFDEFIEKPFDFNNLSNTMRRMLRITDLPAVTPAAKRVVPAMPDAELRRWLERLQPLLVAFDPDALEIAANFCAACADGPLSAPSAQLCNELESYDFVAAGKTFTQLHSQYLDEDL
jgi:PAS domain S-box-containing protein